MWNSCTSVFQTLAHENSMNEMRYRNRWTTWEEKSKYGKKHSGQEKRCSDGLTVVREYPAKVGRYSPKQWLNYQMNLTYTYDPSPTSWGKSTSISMQDYRSTCMTIGEHAGLSESMQDYRRDCRTIGILQDYREIAGLSGDCRTIGEIGRLSGDCRTIGRLQDYQRDCRTIGEIAGL